MSSVLISSTTLYQGKLWLGVWGDRGDTLSCKSLSSFLLEPVQPQGISLLGEGFLDLDLVVTW